MAILCSTKQLWALPSRGCALAGVRWTHQSYWKGEYAINPASDRSVVVQTGPSPTPKPAYPPLSILPLPNLIRSLVITTISSSPILLRPAMSVLSFLAHSSLPILNVDRNPVLHYLLKKTFYAQFCAGETPEEIEKTVKDLKCFGFKGVILGYAKEVVLESGKAGEKNRKTAVSFAETEAEVDLWKRATLQTIALTGEGDFVALKYFSILLKVKKHFAESLTQVHRRWPESARLPHQRVAARSSSS